MIQPRQFYIYNAALYIVGFVLFWEWLRPLEKVTDTANSYYFVIFAGVCFLLYFLRFPFWFTFLCRLVFLLVILHSLFFEGSFFQIQWLTSFYDSVVVNLQKIFQLQWFEMSDLFRSFLFLLLLWVMSYLMHYWLIQIRRIFVFFILTIVYLSILDTFTKYDASEAIVQTVVIGTLMLGSLEIFRLKEKEGLQIRAYWFMTLSIMVALSVGIGLYAPKAGPQWPDPVPFIKSAAKGDFIKSSVNKIGYGINDSRLGGAFITDDKTVFIAEVKKAHYWRIESKDFYTGKGWEVSRDIPQLQINPNNIDLNIFESVATKERLRDKVTVSNRGEYPHIAYPVDLTSIKTDHSAQFLVEPFTGKLFVEENGQAVRLKSYVMTYDYPTFSVAALKLANDVDNTYINKIYTQLPRSLPERVHALAIKITKNQATRYEKVKAIESYFSSHGYVYETKKVAIPGVNQDYVDQFLFETKKGYCDNFSTSMIVMLRTLDIPARWVKGYSQGEFSKTLGQGVKLYEIKNSNAHSWVEVYFPGVGWIPFEPTQGFHNLNSFTEDVVPSEAAQAGGIIEQQPKRVGNEIDKEKANEQIKAQKNSAISLKKLSAPFKVIGISAILVGLLIGLILMHRKRWYPYLVLLNYRIMKKKQSPKQDFEILLLLLENKGLKIQSGETLREFAARVDAQLGISEMKKVTSVYEKILYSNERQKLEEWDSISEMWGSIVEILIGK